MIVVKDGQVTKLANASNIKNYAEKGRLRYMYDIGIIGGGTAGMTAAIYGQRAGKKTIIIEGGAFGGQITSSPNVENYPGIASVSGSEFSMNLLDQAVKLGAETAMEQVTGIRDEGSVKVIETRRKRVSVPQYHFGHRGNSQTPGYSQ